MYLTWNHCVWSLSTIIQPITLIATSAVAIVVSNPSNCDGRSTGSKSDSCPPNDGSTIRRGCSNREEEGGRESLHGLSSL